MRQKTPSMISPKDCVIHQISGLDYWFQNEL